MGSGEKETKILFEHEGSTLWEYINFSYFNDEDGVEKVVVTRTKSAFTWNRDF